MRGGGAPPPGIHESREVLSQKTCGEFFNRHCFPGAQGSDVVSVVNTDKAERKIAFVMFSLLIYSFTQFYGVDSSHP